MTDLATTFTFTPNTNADGTEVNTNFSDIVSYINNRNGGTVTWDNLNVTATVANPVTIKSSAATTEVAIDNTATDGDPILTFKLGGTTKFTLGVDDSDSDVLKLGTTSLTTGDLMEFSTSGVSILGSVTNDAAATGYIGEFVKTSVVGASAVSSTGNAQWFDVCSISLTAGDWNVTGVVATKANGAADLSVADIGISVYSGNNGTDLVSGDQVLEMFPPTATVDSTGNIPNLRFSLASTTTVYLKANMQFTGATSPKAYGRISARRVR